MQYEMEVESNLSKSENKSNTGNNGKFALIKQEEHRTGLVSWNVLVR